jgi:hypothetical protein
MNMKKISLIIGCCLLIMTTTATAQDVQKVQKHELSIYGLLGYSPLSSTLKGNGSTSGSIGGGAGLGYTFNISSSLGITTGVEMSTYGAEISYETVSGKYEVESKNPEFTYSLKNYKEVQSVTVFSIPIMAQYSLPLGGGSASFYASGGFKLGFPMSGKTEITPGRATTEAYFAEEDLTYSGIPQHCLYTDEPLPNETGDFKLGFSTTLSLETGVRFTLTDKIGLYTGLYFDYGLNSIQKESDKHLLEYEYQYDRDNEKLKYHSVLNTAFVDKINLLSIGLKVRIGFKL